MKETRVGERDGRGARGWPSRRAGRRRAQRNRRAFWIALASLAAILAVVIPLSVLPGGEQKVRVEGPAPATTAVPATTAAPRATAPVPTVPQTARLAVVVCPTTFGIVPSPAPASLPSTMAVQVPPNEASELGVYTDNQGTMKLLAPAGWQCRADYGADGSGGVVVYPSGESVPANWGGGWPLPAGSAIEAVAGFETSACVGCTDGQACPLFSSAATAFQHQFGRPCPTGRPAAEAVDQISTGIVGFQDPPGTAGDGLPSGGANPANSVMTYYPNATHGSWRDTCTLPAGQPSLCTAALNNFITNYGTS